MSENLGEGLDNLMIGNASEGVSEQTSEEIAARAAVAAKKIKQLRRDEKSAKNFDNHLAKVLPTFSWDLINFVAFLIDSNLPSLTILAFLSLVSEDTAKICASHFEQSISGKDFGKDLTAIGFEKSIASRIDLWWEFISLADIESKTVKLVNLNTDKVFVERVSNELAAILRSYIEMVGIQDFNKAELERILNRRGQAIFLRK